MTISPQFDMRGSCLCGAIAVQITRPPGDMLMCHCSQCRKTAGAPFHCVFPVAADGFKLHDGEHLLREFRSSHDKARTFCGRCGSPIYSRRDNADSFRVRAGLFEHLDSVDWGGHIFMRDAVGWYHEHDKLPRYDALEPGRGSAKSNKLLPDNC